MSQFIIANGDVKELPECSHKEDGYTCISCEEKFCTHCMDRYQDDSGEYYCQHCKDEYLMTCDRCDCYKSEGKAGLCENCHSEMTGVH